ncbi:actin-like protein, putative [Plasmodium reichenowi]|uniref:Actin-like protein, putative n=1 Tax=Plasmodium reichenowi TaxID=5854 RepID=A0A151LQJ9_PLARE|nr:actin-like protein, putative [Plasmodium reichenowi]KYO01483.1 actin-like protein, putative [Plasmodium reichenowi]
MDTYNDILSIVIDLGFENTKVGYAGDENPTNVFSSNVGMPLDLDRKIKEEVYKKCLCTKDEFYQHNLIYPLFYLEGLENTCIKPCLYLDNKNNFNINEDVFEKIFCMNVRGDRYVTNLFERRVKNFVGNKLYKQTSLGSEFVDNEDYGEITNDDNNNDNDNNNNNNNNNNDDNNNNNDNIKVNHNNINNNDSNNPDCTHDDHLSPLQLWGIENNHFDLDTIENNMVDVNNIKNMLNKYNNISCGFNENIEFFSYLFSIPNMRNKEIKVKVAELLFEKYKVPAIYFNPKAILSGFSYNKNVCSVVDVGSCYTDFSLCNDGTIDNKNYKIYNIGGNTIDYFLEELLGKYNTQYCCPYYEHYKNYNKENIHPDYHNIAKYLPLKDLKIYLCEVADNEKKIYDAKNMNFNENIGIYILPDGQNINITKFNNIAPEIFFTPSLLQNSNKLNHHLNNLFTKEDNFQGTPQTLFHLLKNLNSIKYRDGLINNVIITGSSTLLNNFNQRFEKEFNELNINQNNTNLPNVHILNSGKSDKQYSSWKGGSILASFKNFNSFFVTRKEYQEYGYEIINRKC